MSATLWSAVSLARMVFQRAAFAAIVLTALALAAYSIACAFGYADWLILPLQFGNVLVPGAGMMVQSGITGLFLLLCFFLPTNARVMALENSHRRFHIGMQDVARAYHTAHTADRAGLFTLSSEFDSIRERIAFLREHPDLVELEAPLLEVAAQMSHISRELAQVYSDRNVVRARDFLIARQQEIEDFNTRLDGAKGLLAELRPWLDRIEIDEQIARAQLERLCDELVQILPEIMPDAATSRDDQIEEAILLSEDRTEEPASDEWDDVPDNDPRIVKLLARRAAE